MRNQCGFPLQLLSPVFSSRYDNVTEAYKGVANGSLWGLLVFPANFSSAYVSRMSAPANANQAIINQSSVLVQLDMSNQQVEAVFQSAVARWLIFRLFSTLAMW
jgi:hypothetical protein